MPKFHLFSPPLNYKRNIAGQGWLRSKNHAPVKE